jgi:extracellular elastinolytic metalloproteinase
MRTSWFSFGQYGHFGGVTRGGASFPSDRRRFAADKEVGAVRKSLRLRRILAIWAAVALAATAFQIAPDALGSTQLERTEGALSDLDTRAATVAPTEAQLDAVAALGATARWSDFGSPRSLISHGGFLASGIDAANAREAALAFLDDNRALYGLDSIDGLEVDTVAPIGDAAFVVVLRQRVNGLLVSPEGAASIGVVESARGWKVAYASSSLIASDRLVNASEISAGEALDEALDDAGEEVSLAQMDFGGVTNGWRRVEVEGLRDDQLVRRVAFPTPAGVRVAFETVYTDGVDAGYRHFIDAESGRILYREETVEELSEDNPTWKVFEATPKLTRLNRYPYNYPSADSRQVWCWEDARGCDLAVANAASPLPWDVDPDTGQSTNTTEGNNATTSETWGPAPLTGYRPITPTRDYQYPWTNVWFETECDPSNFVVGSGNDIDAAIANLFAMHNRMHDWSYNLGFTEDAWNAQESNFGGGTLEGDPLIGRAQSGAVVPGSRDNANMSTQPDGVSSITNMFLWQPLAGGFYAPCVDGDYDMAVIGHEYGHMIENRMIGKGFRRQGNHAGAMGESSGDLLAMEYLNEYRFVPVSGENPYSVGPYVTGNPLRAIRNYGMNFRSTGEFPREGRYPQVNPLNLGAVAYDIVGEQVHADGEIWSATNFDIRDLFLDRYPSRGNKSGIECADGLRPVEQCEGNRRWVQTMFDAYLLMPIGPTFLDARDAYLAADMMRFGGANQDLLWRGFARRGFGEDASTTDNGDEQPIPSWESPHENEATLAFEATDPAGNPVDADVYVGHYEARATPIDDVESFVANPEGYEFVARAPGHGFTRFSVDKLAPGENRTITIRFPENWASSANGAVASGDGENHGNLIDETETTNWQDLSAPVEGRQVTVQFDGERQFRAAKVSAYLTPGQNRFSALRSFELYACTAGAATNPTCDQAVAAGWQRILRSRNDAFPAEPPRPVAPDLLLRTFNVPTSTATHVKLVVTSNQCTGNGDFHGEQDQDPSNETDCRATAIANQVRVAELQLLSDRPAVEGAKSVD